MTTRRDVVHVLSPDDLATWLYAQDRVAALRAEADVIARFAVANLARVVPGGLMTSDSIDRGSGEIIRTIDVPDDEASETEATG